MIQVHAETIRAQLARVVEHHDATRVHLHELQAQHRRPPESIPTPGDARTPNGPAPRG